MINFNLFLWVILLISFILCINYLLISLILLEVIAFYLILILSITIIPFILSDFIIICYFSIFVIEGVIGLAGLILLVSFTGSDYLRSSSVLKC